ncbi:MAG: helix-turn-helix domain-containing protein [Oscillibacter sp.]|nr:helix-turn-helix domain-containing protein [Oscillibacter sp.]
MIGPGQTDKTVLICFIGTHAEYNTIKAKNTLGVSPSRVSDYLTGRCEPTLKIAREISRKLNIDAHIVLGV